VSAIAACPANSASTSSSRSVNPPPPPAILLAAKMKPSTRSPSLIGTARMSASSGCADGQPSNRGSARMSASRNGWPSRRMTPSMPCWRGSGPIALRHRSEMPSTTNSANEPRSSGTPSAAYLAPASERTERTMTSSTSPTDSSLVTASTAALTRRRTSSWPGASPGAAPAARAPASAAAREPTVAGPVELPPAAGRYLPMTRRYRRGRPRGSGAGPRTNVAGEPDRAADATAGAPA